MDYLLDQENNNPKSFFIQLKTESPESLKSDIIQAIKHSISLCENNPSLSTLYTIGVFKKVLQGLKTDISKEMLEIELNPVSKKIDNTLTVMLRDLG